MSEETRQVLEMLSAGKVSVLEAEQLLQASRRPVKPPTTRRSSSAIPYSRHKPAREGKKAEASTSACR